MMLTRIGNNNNNYYYSAHGLRNRWKDGVVRDLRSCDLLASCYDVARETGQLGATHTLLWLITSLTCGLFSALFAIRFFPRPSGRARHKCSAERARPVLDQMGTRCCNRCDRWLRSAGGMAVHRSSIFAIKFSSY